MKAISTFLFLISILVSTPCFALKIGVLSAMTDEQASFLEEVSDKVQITRQITKGTLGNHTVYATLSGIGKVNAAIVAQELLSTFDVDIIIFSGVAGGINKNLNIGDIVFASAAFQHDYGFFGDDFKIHAVGTVPELGIGTGEESIYFDLHKYWKPGLFDHIQNHLRQSPPSFQQVMVNGKLYSPALKLSGIVATGDQFVASNTKKELIATLKGDLVEMEGGAVAQVASKHEVPLLIIRSISDKAGEQADIDFKAFFAAVAHNNALILKTIINTIP